ncbi:hypothetical protein TNCT_650761 [Trichonephila clavata]|uniref:Uncharacterized protein n=1 Tax=Trichonephila clavata TaxID=2740835 RepID=A0A8X6FV52_TRICU|nr:hypothetical protein TNCT_650761 [Trichonephila clavata]
MLTVLKIYSRIVWRKQLHADHSAVTAKILCRSITFATDPIWVFCVVSGVNRLGSVPVVRTRQEMSLPGSGSTYRALRGKRIVASVPLGLERILKNPGSRRGVEELAGREKSPTPTRLS